jgi:FKBP-type peptidyl-prolyl cis-trans isomerase
MNSGFIVEKLNEGTGPTVPPGSTVWVHYTGTLTDGKKFDSSYDRGQPFKFVVGKGQVIKGWDEGIVQLKKGQKAKLTCPPVKEVLAESSLLVQP